MGSPVHIYLTLFALLDLQLHINLIYFQKTFDDNLGGAQKPKDFAVHMISFAPVDLQRIQKWQRGERCIPFRRMMIALSARSWEGAGG